MSDIRTASGDCRIKIRSILIKKVHSELFYILVKLHEYAAIARSLVCNILRVLLKSTPIFQGKNIIPK